MRLGFSYNVPIGAASSTNARVQPVGMMEVRLACTVDCYVTIGTAPAATTTGSSLVRASLAGEVFSMAAGEQVAVIAAGGQTGNLNVTEMTY